MVKGSRFISGFAHFLRDELQRSALPLAFTFIGLNIALINSEICVYSGYCQGNEKIYGRSKN
jgi:hypothetical protein